LLVIASARPIFGVELYRAVLQLSRNRIYATSAVRYELLSGAVLGLVNALRFPSQDHREIGDTVTRRDMFEYDLQSKILF
jgi:hypothetical protein